MARVPIGAGPPFVRSAEFVRISDVRAVSPPAWAPDGRSIAFSTADAVWTVRLAAVPAAPLSAQRLARLAGVSRVAWSPDGRMIAALAAGRMLGIPLDDPTPRVVAPLGGIRFVAWPPARAAGVERLPPGAVAAALAAGTRLAGTVVWRIAITTEGGDPADRSRPRRLGTLPDGLEMSSLAWLPGDAGIVAAAEDPRGDDARLVFMRPGGSAATEQVLPAGDHEALPSPEGRFIAYLEDAPDGGARLCVMRADGSGRRVLTAAGRYSGLAWSPSGTLLAVARRSGDRAAVQIVDVLTGEALRIGDYRPEGAPPDAPLAIVWAPDGMRLLLGTDTGSADGFVWLATLERQ